MRIHSEFYETMHIPLDLFGITFHRYFIPQQLNTNLNIFILENIFRYVFSCIFTFYSLSTRPLFYTSNDIKYENNLPIWHESPSTFLEQQFTHLIVKVLSIYGFQYRKVFFLTWMFVPD